jgi:hypothetical protein
MYQGPQYLLKINLRFESAWLRQMIRQNESTADWARESGVGSGPRGVACVRWRTQS